MVEQLALIPTAPRIACRDCHTVFEDLSGHKLCDGCLDEIDWETPRAAQTAHITCRVCGLGAAVPLTHPALLCVPCLADLDATRARVQDYLSAALTALDANQAQWEALRAASPAASRWEAVQTALIDVAEKRESKSVFNRTWVRRKAEGGDFAALLIAYEGYARACDRLAEELARLHIAQREITTASYRWTVEVILH